MGKVIFKWAIAISLGINCGLVSALGLGPLKLGMTNSEVKRFTKLDCEPRDVSAWNKNSRPLIVCEGSIFPSIPQVISQRFTFDAGGRLTRVWTGYMADWTQDDFQRVLSDLKISPCPSSRHLNTLDPMPEWLCIESPSHALSVKWGRDGCISHCRNVRRWQHWVIVLSSDNATYRDADRVIRASAKKRSEEQSADTKQRNLREIAKKFSS